MKLLVGSDIYREIYRRKLKVNIVVELRSRPIKRNVDICVNVKFLHCVNRNEM